MLDLSYCHIALCHLPQVLCLSGIVVPDVTFENSCFLASGLPFSLRSSKSVYSLLVFGIEYAKLHIVADMPDCALVEINETVLHSSCDALPGLLGIHHPRHIKVHILATDLTALHILIQVFFKKHLSCNIAYSYFIVQQ